MKVIRLPIAVLLGALAHLASARWAAPNVDVPIDRLLRNLSQRMKAQPEDAESAYKIGRLHSMAFANADPKPKFYGTPENPEFPRWYDLLSARKSNQKKLTKAELGHLRQSLIYYRRATELAPESGLYKLGLAWMYEQASPFAKQVGRLPWINPAPSRAELLALALSLYRKIYADNVAKDLARPAHLIGVQNAFVSEDAGEAILRLAHSLSSQERSKIEQDVKILRSRISGITPIIFPLNRRSTYADLLDPLKQVGFDFVGDGQKRAWSWVTRDAGILVWDPRRTGKVKSGRQLFGSVTFWLFYSDGYSALADLDDNGDGRLAGKELSGISVWRDANGDGVSDRGEVRPLAAYRIVELRTKAFGQTPVLTAADGVRFADGRVAPTFDWIPAEYPNNSTARK